MHVSDGGGPGWGPSSRIYSLQPGTLQHYVTQQWSFPIWAWCWRKISTMWISISRTWYVYYMYMYVPMYKSLAVLCTVTKLHLLSIVLIDVDERESSRRSMSRSTAPFSSQLCHRSLPLFCDFFCSCSPRRPLQNLSRLASSPPSPCHQSVFICSIAYWRGLCLCYKLCSELRSLNNKGDGEVEKDSLGEKYTFALSKKK